MQAEGQRKGNLGAVTLSINLESISSTATASHTPRCSQMTEGSKTGYHSPRSVEHSIVESSVAGE